MIDKWFIDDIQSVLADHRYIVVTDARGEGGYLLKYLPGEYRQITVKDDWSELEAKYRAESEYAHDKVVFYINKKADNLTYLQEYVQTAGVLVLDDMETYIRQKLFAATGKNTSLSRDKLLLAAKLSEGKDVKWWQSVADGITEPLRLEDWLLDFLFAPLATRQRMDETVWGVFRSEVYNAIGRTPTEQSAETLAQEVVNVMLQSLVDNTIDGLLLTVYQQWADSTEKVDVLRRYIDSFTLQADTNPLQAHPDHPFETLDRKATKMLSEALKYQQDTSAVIAYLKTRTESKKAKLFKPQWLGNLLTLGTFAVKGLHDVSDFSQMARYYQEHFARLDTAMRKIYVAWLNDTDTLRPLQEYYTRLNKELLVRWYSLDGKYAPSQKGLMEKALADGKRTTVIVCDGLRLEIAECVVNGIADKNVTRKKNTAFSVLPSVTENGMSALYGCDEPTTNNQERYDKLKELYRLTCKVPWGSYPKIVHSLNMKNGKSDTPLS